MRSLPALGEFQRRKIWYRSYEHPEQPDLASDESFDKMVGIIGLGSIGLCIAQKCNALGMRVVSTKRAPVTSPWVDVCYPPDGLHDLLRESDFVVIAVPLTHETDHLIGEQQFQMMKSTAYLINISRGAIINQPALIDALQNKRIAGAALDTVEAEPLAADSPLWTLPNVIITPHISANSHYSRDVRSYDAIMANIHRFANNEPLQYIVNRELVY